MAVHSNREDQMASTTYAPTTEQQAALDLFKTGKSLAIEAGAGTGKTSTLIMLAESTERKGQYLAFNKAIVEEAKTKFPGSVACHTAHALAFRAIGKDYAHRLNSPRMKSTDLAKRLGIDPIFVTVQDGTTKRLSPSYLAGLVMRAVEAFCQSADTEPNERHVPYVNGIDVPPGAFENNNEVARQLVPVMRAAWKDLLDKNGSLPYKHSHYLKAWQLSGPTIAADFILFDEAQDANPVMVAIVAAQKHAQLVWVGDSQQQIYSFTGAVNALTTVGAEQVSYLSQSFRFGPQVAGVANSILDLLDADLRLRGFDQIESVVGTCDDPDAILTRTNAEAVRQVFSALKQEKAVHLVGGGTEVVSFAKAARDLMNDGWTSHPELACFDSWNEVREYVEQDEQGGDLKLLVDLIEEFGVDLILEALERMPREEDADLIVSTAHKSKGREWNRVRLASDFSDDPKGEELRLLYVAVTRAKMILDIESVGFLTLILDGIDLDAVGSDLSETPDTATETTDDDTDGQQTATDDGEDEILDHDESVLAEMDDSAEPSVPAGEWLSIYVDGEEVGLVKSSVAIQIVNALYTGGNRVTVLDKAGELVTERDA
jgi:hypothetical protein